MPYDGIGREVRNGLNFTERGFGVRGALGCSDRGHSAASAMKPGDVDWDFIFGSEGVRWFHCGGIFGALSPTTAALALEATAAARAPWHGRLVRPQLPAVALEVSRRPRGCSSDQPEAGASRSTSFSATRRTSRPPSASSSTAPKTSLDLDVAAYERLHEEVLAGYPNLALVATTLREAHTATRNDWSAVCRTRETFHVGPSMPGLEIFDRVGGGDSFASGLIYGLLSGLDVATSLAYGIAHGALAMTTPGDTSMATLAEVERLVAGGSARVIR